MVKGVKITLVFAKLTHLLKNIKNDLNKTKMSFLVVSSHTTFSLFYILFFCFFVPSSFCFFFLLFSLFFHLFFIIGHKKMLKDVNNQHFFFVSSIIGKSETYYTIASKKWRLHCWLWKESLERWKSEKLVQKKSWKTLFIWQGIQVVKQLKYWKFIASWI